MLRVSDAPAERPGFLDRRRGRSGLPSVIHSFTILKRMGASRANVIANYLDLEHIPIHTGIANLSLIAESDRAACFRLDSKVFGFTTTNVHYFEFRPPDGIFQAVKTPLGPMTVLATVREFPDGAAGARCEVTVEVELDMPRWAYPFRRLVERLLRRLNRKVLEEDLQILERRQLLFGDSVADYLRAEQRMLFKPLFAKHHGSVPLGRAEPSSIPS